MVQYTYNNKILSLRNKFSLPSGNSGFSNNHIAATPLGISAVALSTGTFLDLRSAKTPTSNSTLVPKVISNIGNGVTSSNTRKVSFNTPSANLFSGLTQASIFYKAANETGGLGIVHDTFTTVDNPTMIANDQTIQLLARKNGVAVSTGITTQTGHSYFVADSRLKNTSLAYVVVVDLTTGKTSTATVDLGTVISGTSALFGLFSSPQNQKNPVDNNSVYIAASMAALGRSLTMQELLMWSQDPWAFWYPQTQINNISISGQTASDNILLGQIIL